MIDYVFERFRKIEKLILVENWDSYRILYIVIWCYLIYLVFEIVLSRGVRVYKFVLVFGDFEELI